MLWKAANAVDDWQRWRQDAPPLCLDGLGLLAATLETLTLRHLRHPIQLLTSTHLAPLLQCTRLRELVIDGHTLDSFDGLSALRTLELLSLQLSAPLTLGAGAEAAAHGGVVGCACDLRPIGLLRQLRVLRLVDPVGLTRPSPRATPVPSFAPLAACTELRELVLDGMHAADDAHTVDELYATGSWPHLITLSLRGCAVRRPWRLACAPHAASLTELDVSGLFESAHLRRRPGGHMFHTPRPGPRR
jgi:hypothetical protein